MPSETACRTLQIQGCVFDYHARLIAADLDKEAPHKTRRHAAIIRAFSLPNFLLFISNNPAFFLDLTSSFCSRARTKPGANWIYRLEFCAPEKLYTYPQRLS